jgi:hypothetical protein
MQTGIHDISSAQSTHPSTTDWKKLVLNNVELVAAIEANRVEDFVREALAPLYGRYRTFHLIVAETLKSILITIAACVEQRSRADLSTVINHTRLETVEIEYCKRITDKTMAIYWAGEKYYESGTD